ncbi:TIGR02391 family protein [Nocardia wallacei]|uniref:TIGR02391 family protein n=1 Tax=Nocardia wallacei TaxID=480035 RepID=UPI0024538148|nr:TIGR02391 family protein [Nocardia wallacei]
MSLEGVDVSWVRDQLNNFLANTELIYSSKERSMVTRCNRGEAVEMLEIVKPILDRLYPDWTQENPVGTRHRKDDDFEAYPAERDAARRLIVRLDHQAELIAALGGADTSPQISAAGLHPLIWKAASAQWSTGHRHEAVLAAAKAVNSLLQARTGRRDISEKDLVKQTFSDQVPEPGKPRLRFNNISNDQTAKSMRIGVLDFGAGCFGAIRNPIGHLPNDEVELDEQSALERLCALSLLARWIDEADVVTA